MRPDSICSGRCEGVACSSQTGRYHCAPAAVYDDDHSLPARRNEVARESLAWLDRYLGSVH